MLDQRLHKRRANVPIVLGDGIAHYPVKLLSRKPLYVIKGAVCASACIHVHHAQLGPGVGIAATNGGVIRQ
ncbi:hypothetical protein D3C76_1148180 [compost metagenome]